MSSTLLISLALGALSLILVVYILRALWLGLGGNFGSWLETYSLRKKEAQLQSIDSKLELAHSAQLLATLRNAFYLGNSPWNIRYIERIHNHNLAVLTRLVILADKHSKRLEQLPRLENLLLLRCDLMRALYEIKKNRRSLEQRQAQKGRDPADWARAQFDRKLKETEAEIVDNRKELNALLDALFLTLEHPNQSDEVRYH